MLVVVAVGLENMLRKRPWGWRLRAVGSDEESARRIGVEVNRTVDRRLCRHLVAHASGAFMLMAQIGVGDPRRASGYTLTSITAVVLGGTSLLGGRGTFIGTLLGCGAADPGAERDDIPGALQMWQYIFQGA